LISWSDDERFFERMAPMPRFAELADVSHYQPVPDGYSIVLTDVRGSTKAIEAGRYKDVNALGVASLVAVKNALATFGGPLDVPFVFGGDGATLLVPSRAAGPVGDALSRLQTVAGQQFDLGLRASIIPYEVVRDAGHEVLVARHALSPHVSLAMFAGGGLSHAESLLKDDDAGTPYSLTPSPGAPDLEGFECRWRPIESSHGVIVSVLVLAAPDEDAKQVYRDVLDAIAKITNRRSTTPLSSTRLTLTTKPRELSVETRLRSAGSSALGAMVLGFRLRALTAFGKVLMGTGISFRGIDLAAYRDEVALHTDYRKLDDALRMLLDMSPEHADELEFWLERRHQSGALDYGLHRSSQALLTCMVGDYEHDHVHFIDGSDGGYAQAAVGLKAQLEARGAD